MSLDSIFTQLQHDVQQISDDLLPLVNTKVTAQYALLALKELGFQSVLKYLVSKKLNEIILGFVSNLF